MTAALHGTVGASLATAGAARAATGAPASENPNPFFKLHPIGKVEKTDQVVRLRIFDEYVDGLLGLEGWSHVNVFYWFDRNDTPPQRRILRPARCTPPRSIRRLAKLRESCSELSARNWSSR